jgi:ElaB/YqjD/DUF883 family membrane-anchored ribosome-binding protein
MATVLEQAERLVGQKVREWPTLDSVGEVVRDAQKAVADIRHASKNAVEQLELTARRRPLAAVGVAVAGGFVAGAVLAFTLGWFTARRVRA